MKGRRKGYRLVWILVLSIPLLLFAAQMCVRVRLCQAVEMAIEQLKMRMDSSPVRILTDTLSSGSGYTIDATILPRTPEYQLDMTAKVQQNSLLAEGTIGTGDARQNVSFFADDTAIAISSDLLSGGYYGITFASFSQDVRSIPMLEWVLNEKLVAQWNDSLQDVRRYMHTKTSFPNVPEIDLASRDMLPALLMTLPAEMKRTEILQNGEEKPALRIVYAFQNDQIPEMIKKIGDAFSQGDTGITAVFYLSGTELILADIQITQEGNTETFHYEGENTILGGPISFSMMNGKSHLSGCFEGPDLPRERWNVRDEYGNQQSISLLWEKEKDSMEISDGKQSIRVAFQEKNDGFHIKTDNIWKLLDILGEEVMWDDAVSCELTASKGGTFQKPEYKNLDQWSFEDFLTLLDGIGALIGWKIT